MPDGATKYGFQWGDVIVERSWSEKDGTKGLNISTGKKRLDIRITPTGFIKVGEIKVDRLVDLIETEGDWDEIKLAAAAVRKERVGL